MCVRKRDILCDVNMFFLLDMIKVAQNSSKTSIRILAAMRVWLNF